MPDWRKNSSLLASFVCAGRGFIGGLREERSVRLAVIAMLLVLAFGWWIALPFRALGAVFGVWLLLLAVELVNTGFERLADIIHPRFNTKIRAAKDLLAAAVLTVLALALMVTAAVFVPAIVP